MQRLVNQQLHLSATMINGNNSSHRQRPVVSNTAVVGYTTKDVHHDDDNSDDSDANDKTQRSRRRRRRKTPRSASNNNNAGILLFITVVSIFCFSYWSASRLKNKDYQQKLERLQRAKELWQQRQYDAPHSGNEAALKAKHKHTNNNYSSSSEDEMPKAGESWTDHLTHQFAIQRRAFLQSSSNNNKQERKLSKDKIRALLQSWLEQLDSDIIQNVHGGMRWIRPYLLPPHPEHEDDTWESEELPHDNRHARTDGEHSRYFRVDRSDAVRDMKWYQDYEKLEKEGKINGPKFDYTDKSKYEYPVKLMTPPTDGSYPPLKSLKELMEHFPQDDDYPHATKIQETLIHFNFSNPEELEAARRFRDSELPFKLTDIPELDAAGEKWTDEYVSEMFGSRRAFLKDGNVQARNKDPKRVHFAKGTAQESPNNYFAFFVPKYWTVETMGLPPIRNNDWSYSIWAKHAQFADAVALSSDQPHYYWQSGVDAQERYKDKSKWTFVSRDLPSFSATEENFFVFHPDQQKGIQCRFGERGVVAATHFDGGRNMVAMVLGAKRYVLSPPNQCSKLGIFTSRSSPIYRHSLLNFGHISHLHNTTTMNGGMSREERAWLERASMSQAVETVLKKGEVLYIPSHWFHYIVSLQKSAQCNVRSGIDIEGNPNFGGKQDVEECQD